MTMFREAAKGETDSEKSARKKEVFKNILLSLIPFHDFTISRFHDFTKSIVNGDVVGAVLNGISDFVGLVLPAFKGGFSAAKLGVGATTKALKFLKGFAKAGLQAANPLGSVYDAGTGLYTLGKTAIKAAPPIKLPSLDFDRLRHISGRSGSWNIPH